MTFTLGSTAYTLKLTRRALAKDAPFFMARKLTPTRCRIAWCRPLFVFTCPKGNVN